MQTRQSLESEMRNALESKDVTISRLQGKLTVNILDRVLFDSGEADLKPDGAAVLRKVADLLQQHTNLQVHVVGHTDNVPIRAGRSRFASNWELSTARATAAVRFLTEKSGAIQNDWVWSVTASSVPLPTTGPVEGRAKNRRIAITILSEEMAGSDAPAPATAAVRAQPQLPAEREAALPGVTNATLDSVER